MHSYTAFGLDIQSDIEIDWLPPGNGGRDLSFRLLDYRESGQPSPGETAWQRIDRDKAVLNIKDLCQFIINSGREVVICPIEGASENLLRQYLLGPVLALLLYQYGRLVLHASSVVINGTAVAIMAESGWGKSSLAGIFQQRGHVVLSDDLTPVDLRSGSPLITSGLGQLKLHSDVAEIIGLEWDRLQVIESGDSKRGLLINHFLSGGQYCLKNIYVLTDDGSHMYLPIRPQEIIIELIRHSYPTRLGQRGDGLHLKLCGQLARSIKMIRLMRSPDLLSLALMAENIENDLDN